MTTFNKNGRDIGGIGKPTSGFTGSTSGFGDRKSNPNMGGMGNQ